MMNKEGSTSLSGGNLGDGLPPALSGPAHADAHDHMKFVLEFDMIMQ